MSIYTHPYIFTSLMYIVGEIKSKTKSSTNPKTSLQMYEKENYFIIECDAHYRQSAIS